MLKGKRQARGLAAPHSVIFAGSIRMNFRLLNFCFQKFSLARVDFVILFSSSTA